MEDRQILQLFHARNEDALTICRQKYGNYCFAIAHRILQNKEDAEECVNDALLRAWTHIPPDCPTLINAYLGTVTRNIALDRYRKQTAQMRAGEVAVAHHELEAIFSDNATPDTAIEEPELADLINRFLKTLPKQDAVLLVSRYFHFYTVKEIAKRYKMKEKTVYATLSRTLKKLRLYLEKEITL